MDRLNLLISDVDGTLLGNDVALEQFARWYESARNDFRLVYSSGRFVDSVLESIESSNLPIPDAIIGGVGTEIYDVTMGRRITMWPPSLIEWNPYVVQSIGESFPDLTLQPSQLISHYKVSFYGYDLDGAFLEQLRWKLEECGQYGNIIYSSNRDLDILPANADKGAAATYLAQNWRISPERSYVAGDSGNDARMFGTGFRGIVVGNATPELRRLCASNVYQAVNSYAAGVIEGIRYWSSPDASHGRRARPERYFE